MSNEKCQYCGRPLAGEICPAHGYVGNPIPATRTGLPGPAFAEGFSAYNTADTTLPTTGSGWTQITMGGVTYTDGHFASNVYTVPVTGLYLFCSSLYIGSILGTGYAASAIVNNGGSSGSVGGVSLSIAAGNSITSVATGLLPCSAGDVICLRGRCDGGGTASAGNASFMGQRMT